MKYKYISSMNVYFQMTIWNSFWLNKAKHSSEIDR